MRDRRPASPRCKPPVRRTRRSIRWPAPRPRGGRRPRRSSRRSVRHRAGRSRRRRRRCPRRPPTECAPCRSERSRKVIHRRHAAGPCRNGSCFRSTPTCTGRWSARAAARRSGWQHPSHRSAGCCSGLRAPASAGRRPGRNPACPRASTRSRAECPPAPRRRPGSAPGPLPSGRTCAPRNWSRRRRRTRPRVLAAHCCRHRDRPARSRPRRLQLPGDRPVRLAGDGAHRKMAAGIGQQSAGQAASLGSGSTENGNQGLWHVRDSGAGALSGEERKV